MSFPESFRPPDLARVSLSLEGLVTLGATKSEGLKSVGKVYNICKVLVNSHI